MSATVAALLVIAYLVGAAKVWRRTLAVVCPRRPDGGDVLFYSMVATYVSAVWPLVAAGWYVRKAWVAHGDPEAFFDRLGRDPKPAESKADKIRRLEKEARKREERIEQLERDLEIEP